MADEILYAVADSLATITLNRPERRNALNTALMEALAHRFDALESDTSVRAVVIRGAGLERATYELAKTIAGNAPLSLAGMKSTIRRALSLRERVEHKDLDEIARRARASADAREGVRAMLEHRTPTFRGQ